MPRKGIARGLGQGAPCTIGVSLLCALDPGLPGEPLGQNATSSREYIDDAVATNETRCAGEPCSASAMFRTALRSRGVMVLESFAIHRLAVPRCASGTCSWMLRPAIQPSPAPPNLEDNRGCGPPGRPARTSIGRVPPGARPNGAKRWRSRMSQPRQAGRCRRWGSGSWTRTIILQARYGWGLECKYQRARPACADVEQKAGMLACRPNAANAAGVRSGWIEGVPSAPHPALVPCPRNPWPSAARHHHSATLVISSSVGIPRRRCCGLQQKQANGRRLFKDPWWHAGGAAKSRR